MNDEKLKEIDFDNIKQDSSTSLISMNKFTDLEIENSISIEFKTVKKSKYRKILNQFIDHAVSKALSFSENDEQTFFSLGTKAKSKSIKIPSYMKFKK